MRAIGTADKSPDDPTTTKAHTHMCIIALISVIRLFHVGIINVYMYPCVCVLCLALEGILRCFYCAVT